MSDDPFAAFKEGQPPVEAPAKEKKPRKAKKAASNGKAKIKTATVASTAAGYKEGDTVTIKVAKSKKTRKPRAAKEMRLPISMLLEIGSLSDEESGALLSIGAGLQKLPKKSRGKITAALSKIFG